MIRLLKYILTLIFSAGILFGLNSCANMAAPTGGLYDEAPPRVVHSNPQNSALNVNRNIVEIEFDENIKVEKPTEKVIITPPQINMPVIKSAGKKAVVEFNDELLPNTTYTIDFTDAIVDNNEGNPLENFSLSFSTGDQLDTLAVSGKVLLAENLEPAQGIYVGMHTNLDDTAFVRTSFERISRTDSRGRFT
ncbi:MAG TPA: Ig-like domain-containing protein, partial [Petrimonas sp.]|nr:Ig-like domain-containing protein [Petrimonas sp.]